MTFVQHAIDALSLGSSYALAALGIALIFGIVRLVNFAHGELIMVSAYGAWLAASAGGLAVVIVALLAGVAFALIIERIAFRAVRGASPATLLITSFAVGFLLQSLARLIFGSAPRSVAILDGVNQSVIIGGLRVSLLDLVTLAVTVVLMLALAAVLARTAVGREMRAAAEDFEMARLLGIHANRVIAVAFAISGLLAATAALFSVAASGTVHPTMGLAPLLAGVVAVVVGGLGNLAGAVIGAYLLGAVTVALQLALPETLVPYRDAFAFATVIAFVVLLPRGIVASRALQERV